MMFTISLTDAHTEKCIYFQYEFLVLSFYFIKFTKILDSIFHPLKKLYILSRKIHPSYPLFLLSQFPSSSFITNYKKDTSNRSQFHE